LLRRKSLDLSFFILLSVSKERRRQFVALNSKVVCEVLIRIPPSDHIQRIGIRHPCVRRGPSGGHDSTLKAFERRDSGNTSKRMRGVDPRKGRSKVMPLIQLLEVLIVVGVLLWLVNRFIPMQASIKSILNGVVVIAVVLWLLNVFGLFHSLSAIHIGKG
jgi:hypothetical protein